MPSVDQVLGGNGLKADHLQGNHHTLTVSNVEWGEEDAMSRSNQPYKKKFITLFFKETEKSFRLNKTNTETIANITQLQDTDNWGGLKVTFFPTETEMGGERRPCIRIAAVNGYSSPQGFFHESVPLEKGVMPQQPSMSTVAVSYTHLTLPTNREV